MSTGKIWNKTRPMKKPKSTIKNFKDPGEHQYNMSPKFAPGVPNDKNIRRGWYSPDANPGKSRGGSTDVEVEAQTSYT